MNNQAEKKTVEQTRPLPGVTKDTEIFWEAAKDEKLVIQKCSKCQKVQHYPRMFCVHCLSNDVEWVETMGRGKIYSYTISHRPANPYMKDRVPYAVALIDLPEGARILTNIVNTPVNDICIGAEVKVTFEDIGEGLKLPVFEQVEESQ